MLTQSRVDVVLFWAMGDTHHGPEQVVLGLYALPGEHVMATRGTERTSSWPWRLRVLQQDGVVEVFRLRNTAPAGFMQIRVYASWLVVEQLRLSLSLRVGKGCSWPS